MTIKPLRILALVVSLLPVSSAFSQNLPLVVGMARDQDWSALETLLADGVDPNVIYGDGTSALHWARDRKSVV